VDLVLLDMSVPFLPAAVFWELLTPVNSSQQRPEGLCRSAGALSAEKLTRTVYYSKQFQARVRWPSLN
jgi:hypothetical protein